MSNPPLDRKIARRRELYRIAAAHGDVSTALTICDFYAETKKNSPSSIIPYELNYAMMSSIVTAYTRPFSHGKIGQIPGRCIKFSTAEMKELHKELIELRHAVYAHTEAGPTLTVFPACCVPPFAPRPHKGSWSFKRKEVKPEALPQIRALVALMKENLEAEVFSLVEEIGADWKDRDTPIHLQVDG